MSVLKALFEGEAVLSITIDISHVDVAAAKGANFAPCLAHAPPAGPVWPVGPASAATAYSPLRQMVKVTGQPGRSPRELRSEGAVLDPAEKGELLLEPTPVVINCPTVQRPGRVALQGLVLPRPPA